MSRLSIEIPDDLHQQIKANASLRGLTMRDFVLERLGVSVRGAKTPQNHPAKPYRGNADDPTPAPGSVLELLENRPWQGTRTKAEIDAYIAEERASWGDDI